MIGATSIARRMEELLPIGRSGEGTTRLPWTPELAKADRWFEEQAAADGLEVRRDPAGNLWACPDSPAPWWACGSHLDSVRCGGAYDGALGVAAAFEVARAATVPVAVISFADEEGARFNTPTFGSRALCGSLVEGALERVDADGVRLADAMAGYGVDPGGVADTPAWLERLRGFLELHIDQSLAVDAHGAPFAVATSLAARVRAVADLRGRADHAGTTPMDERVDALAAAARVIVAAVDVEPPARATATRIEVEPNAQSTVAQRARVWLDSRAPEPAGVDAWLAQVTRAVEAAGAEGTLELQSRSDGVSFDAGVRAALAAGGAPEIVCFAGHDAGILAERLPAGMVLVRNTTGGSHAPEEHVELADAAEAANAMVAALEALA